MSSERAPGIAARPRRCVRCRRNISRLGILPSTCLAECQSSPSSPIICDLLCITLPSASSTAWLVKFSEGMRLMKCFCLRFSCNAVSPSPVSSDSNPTHLLHNVVNSRISLFKVGGQQLVLRILRHPSWRKPQRLRDGSRAARDQSRGGPERRHAGGWDICEGWVWLCGKEAKGESNVMFKLRSRLGLSIGCITYHAWAFAWWRGGLVCRIGFKFTDISLGVHRSFRLSIRPVDILDVPLQNRSLTKPSSTVCYAVVL
jgi:hypothetical protein